MVGRGPMIDKARLIKTRQNPDLRNAKSENVLDLPRTLPGVVWIFKVRTQKATVLLGSALYRRVSLVFNRFHRSKKYVEAVCQHFRVGDRSPPSGGPLGAWRACRNMSSVEARPKSGSGDRKIFIFQNFQNVEISSPTDSGCPPRGV